MLVVNGSFETTATRKYTYRSVMPVFMKMILFSASCIYHWANFSKTGARSMPVTLSLEV